MRKKFCLHDEHSCTPFFSGPTDTWKSCSMWIFYVPYSLLVHEVTVSVLMDTNSMLCPLEHVWVLLYWLLMSSEPVISCLVIAINSNQHILAQQEYKDVWKKITNYASIDLTSSLDQILGLREPTVVLLQQNKMDLESGRSVKGFLSVKKSAVNSILLCLPALQGSCIRANQRLE